MLFEPFCLLSRKNIWCIAGYWRKERCEQGEMKERCKDSRDWNNKIARKRGRFGGDLFVCLLYYLLPFTVLKYTNWFI
jgi:hypothetical protein